MLSLFFDDVNFKFGCVCFGDSSKNFDVFGHLLCMFWFVKKEKEVLLRCDGTTGGMEGEM